MSPAIDMHQHLWPEPLLRELARRREPPRLVRHRDGWAARLSGEPEAAVDLADHDPSRRAMLVHADGLELALVAPSTPLGIEALPAAEAEPLLDAYHEGVEELPAEFGAWAAVGLADPRPSGSGSRRRVLRAASLVAGPGRVRGSDAGGVARLCRLGPPRPSAAPRLLRDAGRARAAPARAARGPRRAGDPRPARVPRHIFLRRARDRRHASGGWSRPARARLRPPRAPERGATPGRCRADRAARAQPGPASVPRTRGGRRVRLHPLQPKLSHDLTRAELRELVSRIASDPGL